MRDDPHTAFRECLRSFVNQDYETSLKKSHRLWDEYPSFHPGALVVMSLQRLGRFEEAERFGARIVQAAGDLEWDQQLISVLVGKRPIARVIPQADSADKRAAALYYEGARLVGEGSIEEAVPWLTGARETQARSLEVQLAQQDFLQFVVEPEPDEDVSRLLARTDQLREDGDLDEALGLARRATDVAKDALGDRHLVYAEALQTLASVHDSLNNRDEAVKALKERREILHDVFGSHDPLAVQASEDLGRQLYRWGRWEPARERFDEVVAYYEDEKGKDHPDTVTVVKRLADTTIEAGQHEHAIPMYERVLDHAHDHADEPRRRHLHQRLGHCHIGAGNLDDAEAAFQDALELSGMDRRSPAQNEAYGHYGLIRVALERGEEDHAQKLADQVFDELKTTHEDDPGKVAHTISNIANNLHTVGYPEFALPYKERALEIYQAMEEVPVYKELGALEGYADCLADLGRHEEAADLFEEAYRAWKQSKGAGHRSTVRARNAWEQARQEAKTV